MNNDSSLLYEIIDRLSSLETQVKQYNQLLKEHMRRTELLEDRVLPIERKLYKFQGAVALLGIVLTVFEIYKFIHSL